MQSRLVALGWITNLRISHIGTKATRGLRIFLFRFFQPIGKLPFSYKGASHLFFQLEKKICQVPL